MASFKKRGQTWTYYIKVGVDPRTGKYKQKSKGGFKTKKAAQAAAAEMERTFTFEGDRNPRFDELFHEWWESYRIDLKPATIQSYQVMYRSHILPYFAKLKIKNIQRHHCQSFVSDISERLPGTAKMVRTKTSQLFKYAIDQGIITTNPMKGVSIPKKSEVELLQEQKQRNYWTRDEVNYFLSESYEQLSLRDYVLFRILLFSGMRKGEALALEWGDIDFRRSSIHIHKTVFFENKEMHVQRVKTASSKRNVSMDDGSMQLLRRLYTEQTEKNERINAGMSNIIFQRDTNTEHLRLSHPNEKLKNMIHTLDLHPITIHGMRHTHASLLFESGVDIKDVQERLGHSNIKMTLDIYTHVTESKKEKSAQMFADYMQSQNFGDKLVTLEEWRKNEG